MVMFKLNVVAVILVSMVINSLQALGYVTLMPFSSRLKRDYNAWVQRLWVTSIAALLYPTKLLLTGDLPSPTEPTVFLVNHQVDADWWFMWVLAKSFNKHGHLKIILKGTLRWIPVVGWGMRFFEFIFLQRDLKRDGPLIEQSVQSFLQDRFPVWLLLFPEGTTVHEEYIAKSQAFAKQSGRPILRQTVLPRTNGFTSVLAAVPDSTKVFDCTMVYSGYGGDIPDWNDGYERKKDTTVPSLRKMFSGMQTPPTYLHLRAHTAGDIKRCGVEKFLDERWVEKDEILAHYAATGRMPEDRTGAKHLDIVGTGSLVPVTLIALSELSALSLITWGLCVYLL